MHLIEIEKEHDHTNQGGLRAKESDFTSRIVGDGWHHPESVPAIQCNGMG